MRYVDLEHGQINVLALLGYLAAVTGGALFAAIVMFGALRLQDYLHGITPRPDQAAAVSCLMGVVTWYVTLLVSWPAVVISYFIAKRFRITRLSYYLFCGLLAAVIYTPLVHIAMSRTALPTPPPPYSESSDSAQSYIEQLANTLVLFAGPLAVSGALIFWIVAGRRLPRYGAVNRNTDS